MILIIAAVFLDDIELLIAAVFLDDTELCIAALYLTNMIRTTTVQCSRCQNASLSYLEEYYDLLNQKLFNT